jgi:hypothetical protein
MVEERQSKAKDIKENVVTSDTVEKGIRSRENYK